jgi:hypothetical protein
MVVLNYLRTAIDRFRRRDVLIIQLPAMRPDEQAFTFRILTATHAGETYRSGRVLNLQWPPLEPAG